jgi:hypothetical protein
MYNLVLFSNAAISSLSSERQQGLETTERDVIRREKLKKRGIGEEALSRSYFEDRVCLVLVTINCI